MYYRCEGQIEKIRPVGHCLHHEAYRVMPDSDSEGRFFFFFLSTFYTHDRFIFFVLYTFLNMDF